MIFDMRHAWNATRKPSINLGRDLGRALGSVVRHRFDGIDFPVLCQAEDRAEMIECLGLCQRRHILAGTSRIVCNRDARFPRLGHGRLYRKHTLAGLAGGVSFLRNGKRMEAL